MVSDHSKVTAEVWWIRLRAKLHLVVKLAGLVLVFLALFNLFGPVFTGIEAVAPYRSLVQPYITGELYPALIADLVVLTVGMVLTWWG